MVSTQTLQILDSQVNTIFTVAQDTKKWIERREDPEDDEVVSILAALDNIESAADRLKREMENP